jgi:hypothetical protein
MSTAAPIHKSSSSYDVPRAQGKCSVCGRDIPPGEKLMAVVRETPVGLDRLDISLDCWANFDRTNLLGFWQSTMTWPEEKKKLFVDDEVLCQLFERLADATEPAKVNFRFVLGLILMRKRLIVYEGARRENDRDLWIVRLKGREEKLDLFDPKLGEQEMAEVSQQLGQILHEEL